MISLIDGRGQLGSALETLISSNDLTGDVSIYHTWNFLDKSEKIQERCYEKFKEFVNNNTDSRIVFISTYSQTENYYNFYKQLSEAYLIQKTDNGQVIRLPTLIGKGICQKIRDEKPKIYGEIELMSIEEAAKKVLEISTSSQLIRSVTIPGTKVPAKIVNDLILFGKKGT